MSRHNRLIQLEGFEPGPEPARPAVRELPKRECLIAIDFDRTFTADRKLWRALIHAAIDCGHRVVCVTNRQNNAANRQLLQRIFGAGVWSRLAGVVYCNHAPKRYTAGIYGFRPDIWIEDTPEVITAATAQDVARFERIFPEKETLPLV